eukprot:CAMPEP_0179265482 /NCGR_PEP_ID=MMETSP0797-20121207/28925_1 /TAXON_ID=47934 /ORGANISM="Dinophysis acuminata, Strain DAEP01" /LENGTH=235 /DNA_ID=CAMNT_0020973689 /DNA_START=66 /DNA_END=771 /DNA_ORIENTATION=-
MTAAVVAPYSVDTDSPDTLPPTFWPTAVSKLDADVPNDLLCPGYGEPSDGKTSTFYHYPDAVFSNTISMQTREWLRACYTDIDKVKEMCEGGIDIHQANANGFTGLHMAASKFKLDIAEYLVSKGHDVNIEECNGLTPLDYCIDSGASGQAGVMSDRNGSKVYAAMVEFLESKGACRKEERAWLYAANQEKFAPNVEGPAGGRGPAGAGPGLPAPDPGAGRAPRGRPAQIVEEGT